VSQSLFVVNAGSSSIKFKLYDVSAGDLALRIAGALDGIGSRPRLHARDHDGAVLVDQAFPPAALSTSAQAQEVVADFVRSQVDAKAILGVGHRVVHGGTAYSQPVLVDDTVLRTLETFISLAPLHQLSNLDPIRVIRERRPDLPQVACFDTAFHRGHPEISDRFAIPRHFYDEGVRRYGFHGLSYEYVSGALRDLAPEVAAGRVVIVHLGSGASACGLKDGRSQETTMGFTALDGLPMGTRSGALDAGVVLHLIEQKGMTPAEVGHMLYHESGLLGLSGVSKDVRELLASEAEAARMALDYFALKVAQAIGSLAITLDGLDGLVFTAGIGEHAPEIRDRIVQHLRWTGLALDPAANAAGAVRIGAPDSRVPIFVIPTDEERMIAQHTLRLLRPAG